MSQIEEYFNQLNRSYTNGLISSRKWSTCGSSRVMKLTNQEKGICQYVHHPLSQHQHLQCPKMAFLKKFFESYPEIRTKLSEFLMLNGKKSNHISKDQLLSELLQCGLKEMPENQVYESQISLQENPKVVAGTEVQFSDLSKRLQQLISNHSF